MHPTFHPTCKIFDVGWDVGCICHSFKCYNCLKTGHLVKNCTSQHCFACKRKHHISICESRINLVKKDNSSENQAPQNKIINSKGNNESGSTSSLTTLLIDHLSKNSLSQTSQANNELGSSSSSTTLLIDHSSKNSLLQTANLLKNSMKIEKRILFDDCSEKPFITKQLQ